MCPALSPLCLRDQKELLNSPEQITSRRVIYDFELLGEASWLVRSN